MTTGYGLDGRGSTPAKARDFCVLHSIQTGSGAYSATYPMVNGDSSREVKRQGNEADHTPVLVLKSRMVELSLQPPYGCVAYLIRGVVIELSLLQVVP
jgi:hypothetical protein